MDTIKNIVPSTGWVAIFGFNADTKQGFKPEYLNAENELGQDYIDSAVERLRNKGATDFYHTIASFTWPEGTPRSRAAIFANSFRSYIIDVDCHGKEGEYKSPKEAVSDIIPKLASAGIPATRIVFTGRGIQVIWSVDRDMSAQVWQKLSVDMWSIIKYLDIKADSSVQLDRARIFRLPGTVNSKNGLDAKVILDETPYSLRVLRNNAAKYIADNNVVIIQPERDDSKRTVDNHGDVYVCEENEKMLRWIVSRIPSDFSKIDVASSSFYANDGYSAWRNIVWAIKRTGLPAAWDIAEEWAMQSASVYDDLEESLRNTWDSDNREKNVAIGPGTLVAAAELFAPSRKKKGIKGFHFYTEEEVNDIRRAKGWVPPDKQEATLSESEAEEYATLWYDDEGDLHNEQFCELWPDLIVLDYIDDILAGTLSSDNQNKTDASSDGRTDGFGGELADTPPTEFGSPEYDLPKGYTHKKDEHGRITGLYAVVKRDTKDDEAGEELIQIATSAVELLAADRIMRDTGYEFSYHLRSYDNVTGKPCTPFTIPASTLASPVDLGKLLSKYGVILGANPKASTSMSIYLRTLAEKKRKVHHDRIVHEQAGWTSNFHEFILGKVKINSDGKLSSSQLTPQAESSCEAFGKVSGTEAGQWQVLESYGGNTPSHGRAILAMMLGAPLAAFMATPAASVYTYSDRTNTGKSTVHKIGLGLYGDLNKAELIASSTINALEEAIIIRKDLPLYIDEFSVSRQEDRTKGGRSKSAEDMRAFILHMTAQTGRRRMNSSGGHSFANNKKWSAPAFMSSNDAPESFMGVKGGSTEATYARLLTVPYDDMEGIFRNGMMNGDELAERKIKNNYGFIGPRFLKHVMCNQKSIRKWLDNKYAELSEVSEKNGTPGLHRFYNTTITCGLYALKWIEETGCLSTWNFQETADFMVKLAFNNDEEANQVMSNNVEEVLNSFRSLAANSTVICRQGDKPFSYPELSRFPVITIRVEEDKAMLHLGEFKKFCINNGIDSKRAMRKIAEQYGYCHRSPVAVNFTKGIDTNRQSAKALIIPARAIVDKKDMEVNTEKKSNVVRLGR